MKLRCEQIRWIYRAWRYRLVVEPQGVRAVLKHLQLGDTAIDIGAHKGAYTYWMRSRVGTDGRVVAFEPQGLLAKRLKRLVARRGFDNVTVVNAGASSSTGERRFFADPHSPSPGASFDQQVANSAESTLTPVSALDDYLADGGFNKVHLIKCDAEGHELEVFQGAREVLKVHRPILLFECEVRHRKERSVDGVFDFLTALGYRGVALGRRAPLTLDEFDPQIHQHDAGHGGYVNNFLFQHPGSNDVR